MSTCQGECDSQAVTPPQRKYCRDCSKRARAIWMKRLRRLLSAQWREGLIETPPWLDYWPSLEARRAYYRQYMKAWRLKRKAILQEGS